MTLPIYWRRASFTVAETAEMIGVSEETLRTWLARAPINDFLGAKTGGRLYLSAQDGLFYLMVKELTAFGVPVRTAMLSSAPHVDGQDDEICPEQYLLVQHRDGTTRFHLTDTPSFDDRTTLIIPIRRAVERLLEKAGEIYATAES